MGCGGAKRSTEKQVVQIGVTGSKSLPVSKRKPTVVGDFHCGVCGLTLKNRRPDYYHNCQGPRPIAYQQERLAKCNECKFNVGDVCQVYKGMHPERDAIISIGVTMSFAACPIGQWDRKQIDCPSCSCRLFDANGVTSCKYCGWALDNKPKPQASIESQVVAFLKQCGDSKRVIEEAIQKHPDFIQWAK